MACSVICCIAVLEKKSKACCILVILTCCLPFRSTKIELSRYNPNLPQISFYPSRVCTSIPFFFFFSFLFFMQQNTVYFILCDIINSCVKKNQGELQGSQFFSLCGPADHAFSKCYTQGILSELFLLIQQNAWISHAALLHSASGDSLYQNTQISMAAIK